MKKEARKKRGEGVVVDVLPNAMFRVKLDTTDALITGVISGRMRQNNIKILLGDTVEVEFSLGAIASRQRKIWEGASNGRAEQTRRCVAADVDSERIGAGPVRRSISCRVG